MEISANEFKRYLEVQYSGKTNMINVKVVKALSGLSDEKIFHIMENYETLETQFPEIVSGME